MDYGVIVVGAGNAGLMAGAAFGKIAETNAAGE